MVVLGGGGVSYERSTPVTLFGRSIGAGALDGEQFALQLPGPPKTLNPNPAP